MASGEGRPLYRSGRPDSKNDLQSFELEFLGQEASQWYPTVLKYGSLAVFLVASVGEQVLLKKTTYAAKFPAALTQLKALGGVIVFPLIVMLALWSGLVSRREIVLPLWKPATIAVGFSLHNVLLNVGAGSRAVSGIIIMVLAKVVVPVSMLLNIPRCTMGLSYGPLHWTGLLVLMGGVVLTVLRPLLNALSTPGLEDNVVDMLLIVLSTVPLAASFTFIEVSLTHEHKELFTTALWMYVCVFEFFICLFLLPLSVALSHVPLAQMWPHLTEGLACYTIGVTPAGADIATDCPKAAVLWWGSGFFVLCANLVLPVCTRYGGATLMWFVRAMAVPIASMIFSSPAFMGQNATHLEWSQMFGLVIVTVGVLLFNHSKPGKR